MWGGGGEGEKNKEQQGVFFFLLPLSGLFHSLFLVEDGRKAKMPWPSVLYPTFLSDKRRGAPKSYVCVIQWGITVSGI